MAEQKLWARDRDTGKVGQYSEGFLAAWPNDYLRVDAPKRRPAAKAKEPAARSASPVPKGTNPEGGA